MLRGTGAHVISVGIGNWLDRYELRAIASYPTELNLINVENFDSITNIRSAIRDAVCNSMIISILLIQTIKPAFASISQG